MTNRPLLRRVLLWSSVSVAVLAWGSAAHARVSPAQLPAPDFQRQSEDLERVFERITLQGVVRTPNGSPARGAVVVTSAGGQAVTDAEGSYSLELRVPREAESFELTAVGRAGSDLLAHRQVQVPSGSGGTEVLPLQLAPSSGCSPNWIPTFGGAPGTNSLVQALQVFDDGNGAALYVAGAFQSAGGVAANLIAKWDGTNWEPLGAQLSRGGVRALAVFDDGNGAALYAGGSFDGRIAKWNGSSWLSVGGANLAVFALEVLDDGTGPALYAGGNFSIIGGQPATQVAKWDGVSWSPLGSGVILPGDFSGVYDLAQFDDGTGSAIYAAGRFTLAGGAPANNIAKWDGSSWTPLGSGTDDRVEALAVFDDGSGEALYAGGIFSSAGGATANRVAKWDGTSWSPLGSGTDSNVLTLEVLDDGSGPALFAGGTFNLAGGAAAHQVAKWDGSSWAPLAGGIGTFAVSDLTSFDDGNGSAVYAGGNFTMADGEPAHRIARWDGTSWSPVQRSLNSDIFVLAAFDDGGGPELYAAGPFETLGTVAAQHIAKWDGSVWTPLGAGIDGTVGDMVVFDDGGGEALYVGGLFTTAGGVAVNNIARWDGTGWSAVGSSALDLASPLVVFDDGSGAALYAGGSLSNPGISDKHVVKWDGSSWSQLPGGVNNSPSQAVLATLEVFDDGSGEALYAGGLFTSAGGATANGVAKWNGSTWSALGSGMGGSFPYVTSLKVFDDGGGEALYAGGYFATADGVDASKIAKWDGSNWTALGSGISNHSEVFALTVFDDGSGNALYAGGQIFGAGGRLVNNIAKWDGANWAALGRGTIGDVRALECFDDGGGNALYVGGRFSSAVDSGDSFLAKWGCQEGVFRDFCNGVFGSCTFCPCSNRALAGTIGGCLNGSATSARLHASGSPSVSSDTMRFELTGGNPNTTAILASGALRAPANGSSHCFGQNTGVTFAGYDGLRCVVQSVQRHGQRAIDANGDVGSTTNGWGSPSGPAGGLIAQGGFVAGQSRHYQAVYREDVALGCGSGLNTTQGISITFVP